MANAKLSDVLIDNAQIGKKLNIINLILANIFIIAGIVLFIIANSSTAMILGGIAALLFGFCILIKFSTKLIHKSTCSSVCETSIYIKSADIDNIVNFLKTEGVNISNTNRDGSGDYRLDIVKNTAGNFICGMFFQYAQYEYKPSTDFFEISDDVFHKLMKKVK